MPKTKISEFSATPGNNTDIDGINISEGCPPSGINDAIRELMAQLKDFQAGTAGDSFNGPIGTTTPAAGAFTNLSASGTFALTGDQVQISEGGTGQTTANAAFNALAPSQTSQAGKYLKTDGTNTSWDAIDINTADITGTLPIANGGTGLTALGTGVQTALGIAVGSSGAFVTNGGALGTPSSGTVTNLTGTASININGTVGATTPTTGAFTTLSASGNITVSGGTANGVAYLNGSKVLTTGSALTFDGGSLVGTGKFQSQVIRIKDASFSEIYFSTADTGGNGAISYNQSANAMAFYANGSEQMRLTSTGLGIGTSSPDRKLSTYTTDATGKMALFSNGNTNTNLYLSSDPTSGGGVINVSNNAGSAALPLLFQGNGTTRMYLDSSGNLGLGVTPSAWASDRKAYQVGRGGALVSGTAAGFLTLSSNAFWDGSNYRYIATDFATLYAQTSGQHFWSTAPSGTAGNAISFTQAMTLDASGNLGVGTTSPAYRLQVETPSATGNAVGYFRQGSGAVALILSTTDLVGFGNGATSGETRIYADGASGLVTLRTNSTERARITSGGYFKASDNGTYNGGAFSYHEFNQSADGNAVVIYGTNATLSTSGMVFLQASRNTTNNSFYALSYYNDGAGAYRLRIADSGNVTNTNGSYGTISDAKMKTDIVDAGSQWADIKAIRFRKFKMKDDPEQIVQLGVVAQELEQTSPGLVDEHTDRDKEGNDLGTTTKSVKTSVLLMKAAVALQEAMVRIEQLEAKVAALEAK